MESTLPGAPSRGAMYAWLGWPTLDSVRVLPMDLGVSCMPTPLDPGPSQPLKVANNTGRAALGVEKWPGPPTQAAPYALLRLPNGLGSTVTLFFQGIIFDRGAPNGSAAVTNGIRVVSG